MSPPVSTTWAGYTIEQAIKPRASSLDYVRRDVSIRRAWAMRSGGNEAGRTSEQKANRHAFLFHTDAALGTGIPGERRNLILAKTDEDGQEETLNPVRRLR
jgi:hypothetical protein